MRIPDEKIEDIRNTSDIVDVISGTVQLKKRGKNYLGLCPFHNEKTPSFTVSAEKQMYHCFGCGKGGNVFTFVMETEKVSFIEAVRMLAAKAGIEIPEESQPLSAEQSETERLYAACRFAGMQFYKQLVESEEGAFPREYFRKRGFTDETIRNFGLGYALKSWESFVRLAAAEGFTADELVKAGLARKRDDGSLYDYYRGRVMFPIMSVAGRVIGFGARKIWDDDPIQGKYINSPETPIYNKSRVLFGLFHAKEAIRHENRALIVEGYADLISLYQAGICHVVASSGTALTVEQLNLLGHYSKNVTLVYDGDSAGSKATVRGIDLALEHDMNVQVVELPEGDDPDSFVQREGGPAFRDQLTNAVSFIDFKAKQYQRVGAFATPEGKADAVRGLMQSLAKMKDELKRDFYIKQIAEQYDVYEHVLRRELGQSAGHERKSFQRESAPPPTSEHEYAQGPEEHASAVPIPSDERMLIKVMLEGNSEVLQFIFANISLESLSHEQVRKAFQFIADVYDTYGTVDAKAIVHDIPDEGLRSLISDLTLSRYELSPGWKAMEKTIEEPDPMLVAQDVLRAMQKKAIQHAQEETQHAIKEAQMRSEPLGPLMEKQNELARLLNQLNQDK